MNKLLASILLFSLMFASCEKAPGPGGKAAIHVTVIRGNVNVADAIVKIKYGATAYAGPNANYDETLTADYAGDVSFTKLTRGDYYVYAMSPDTTLASDFEGGAHVLINNKPGETHVVIDFSEEDPF